MRYLPIACGLLSFWRKVYGQEECIAGNGFESSTVIPTPEPEIVAEELSPNTSAKHLIVTFAEDFKSEGQEESTVRLTTRIHCNATYSALR